MAPQAFDLLLRDARLLDRGGRVDLGIDGGRIVAIGDCSRALADQTLELEGRLVLPGFVESHIHLDRALLSGRTPSREGTLAEALRLTSQAKRASTVEDIRQRARQVLEMAIRHGTTAVRSHVEVDPVVGLKGFEALLPLKTQYAPAIDLQLCAFTQEGILKNPGTEDLLREALRMGADLIGGCPYSDADGLAQIDVVFGLAKEFDTDVDFHIDYFDEPAHLHVRYVAEKAIQEGYQGRVAVGHLTELAALEHTLADRLMGLIAEAGIAVITLPATDLYLMGRGDQRNVRRGLAPVKRLMEAGVTVAVGSNNVQNAFTPFGRADLLQAAHLLAIAGHMGTEADLRRLLDMATTNPARILGLVDYGLHVGCQADLVVLECQHPTEAVAAVPERRWVIKHGALTVSNDSRTTLHFRKS
jgi:cytosine deaminase